MDKKYIDEVNKEELLRLRKNIKTLPTFVGKFFLSIGDTTALKTRLGYSYDLRIFFIYLTKENPDFAKDSIRDFTIDDIKRIKAYDIAEFLDYLTYYTKVEDERITEVTNSSSGKSRKLSAIRSLFWYLYKNELIESNPSELVDIPKLNEKTIITLDVHEVANLLDEIEYGDNLTSKQKDYHKITKKRDLALVTALLGTGMRISECIGLNIYDINLENNSLKITRKGGDESILYFNDEVAEVLADYIAERKKKTPLEGHENALFLSIQNKRISPRTVQKFVKKYAQIITPLKTISPHKLRSTYGTSLYRESQDIYLVAEALGHKDVNTTRKHYAKMGDERRRQASTYINLRKS